MRHTIKEFTRFFGCKYKESSKRKPNVFGTFL